MRRALTLALLPAASTASAHPHVFADATVEVRFGERGLEGVGGLPAGPGRADQAPRGDQVQLSAARPLSG
jgi:hypothetical protein